MKVDEDLFAEIVRFIIEDHNSNFLFYPMDVVAYHIDVLQQRSVLRRSSDAPAHLDTDCKTMVRKYVLNEPLSAESRQYVDKLIASF